LSATAASRAPKQAVVLAGGRGTRLRPLTDTLPKPMIEFNGRPFLEYLVALLRDQGFEEVLLLLGYRPEAIQEHFGDGSGFGIKIDYSVTSPHAMTASRMMDARHRLDPTFLMLYCDNYWPMRMDRLWARYQEAGAPALVTVYRNTDAYSRDNVRLDGEGFVAEYDRSRASPDLRGVEIGYAILQRSLVDQLSGGHQQIEEALYPTLARNHELAAFVTDHRYYSIGSLERLPTTERFLQRHPTLFLDRDGVLNRRPEIAGYVRRPDDVEWLPGALDAVRRLTEAGVRLIVLSNQAGVARGSMTSAELAVVEGHMRDEISAARGEVARFYYCTHGWDEGCDCRKPRPGMLFQAQRDFDLDLSRVPFVGDDERDGEAAAAAGSPFFMVTEDRTLSDVADQFLHEEATRLMAI
jgi:histidinol-phosphate phosphatase family protein